jgi:hypothetical protein
MLGVIAAAVTAGLASRLPVAAQEADPVTADSGSLGLSLDSHTQVQDLTHTITSNTPLFPGNPQPEFAPLRIYETDGYYANVLTYAEHSGTHMDAPAHFVDGAAFASDLPVKQ